MHIPSLPLTQILAVMAALIAGLAAYLLGRILAAGFVSPASRIEDITRPAETLQTPPGVYEHRVRLFFRRYGLHVEGRERLFSTLLRIGLPVVVLLVCLAMHLPLLIGFTVAAIAAVAVGLLFDSAWERYQAGIETDLPAFLASLSATLQVTQDVPQAVDQESEGLPPNSPLRDWLRTRFLPQVMATGVRSLDALQTEAYGISSALGVAVFLIGRVWRTGGPEWVGAFSQAKENLRGLLAARATARSAASGANNSILVIIAMSAVVMLFMLLNPGVSSVMQQGTTQIIYAVCLIVMAFGYGFIHNMVRDML